MLDTKFLGKKVLEFKKDLNRIAEPSWKEFKTRDYVVRNLGGDFVWSDKTALVYKIGGGVPVFFRAELDALNTSSGPKHVCGHSSHLAALMAAYLYFKKNPIQGYCVYFVFQPSEESYPSGAGFISKNFPMIKKCRAGFAFHVLAKFAAGKFFDPTFAFADYFEITVQGRATHIKYKNDLYHSRKKLDALLVGAELVKEINGKQDKHWIINAGTFSGGESPNKIAGAARLSGDVRGFDYKYGKIGEQFLRNLCKETRKKYRGIKISLYYNKSVPAFKNDKEISSRLESLLGVRGAIKTFGTEDFSLYPVKKGFLLVGAGGKEELHGDEFSVPDSVTLKIFKSWIKIGNNLSSIIV